MQSLTLLLLLLLLLLLPVFRLHHRAMAAWVPMLIVLRGRAPQEACKPQISLACTFWRGTRQPNWRAGNGKCGPCRAPYTSLLSTHICRQGEALVINWHDTKPHTKPTWPLLSILILSHPWTHISNSVTKPILSRLSLILTMLTLSAEKLLLTSR